MLFNNCATHVPYMCVQFFNFGGYWFLDVSCFYLSRNITIGNFLRMWRIPLEPCQINLSVISLHVSPNFSLILITPWCAVNRNVSFINIITWRKIKIPNIVGFSFCEMDVDFLFKFENFHNQSFLKRICYLWNVF